MFKSRSKAGRLLRQLQLKQFGSVEEEPEPVKQDYLSERDCHRTYSCIHCRAHLANHDELISKLFQGNHGRAYLFNKVLNVGCKQAVERELLTGLHAVADIYCDCCETTLGWKYEQAFVPSQKYKEGKYIIELVHMLKENNWDLTSYNSDELLEQQQLECSETSSIANTRPQQQHQQALLVNDREVLALDTSSHQATRRPQLTHAVAAASLPPRAAASKASLRPFRKPFISNSSSYTTINLRPPTPQEDTFNHLDSSGASQSGTSSSGGGGGGDHGGVCGGGGSSSSAASCSGSSGSGSSSSSEGSRENLKQSEGQEEDDDQVKLPNDSDVSCTLTATVKRLLDPTKGNSSGTQLGERETTRNLKTIRNEQVDKQQLQQAAVDKMRPSSALDMLGQAERSVQ